MRSFGEDTPEDKKQELTPLEEKLLAPTEGEAEAALKVSAELASSCTTLPKLTRPTASTGTLAVTPILVVIEEHTACLDHIGTNSYGSQMGILPSQQDSDPTGETLHW